MHKVSPQIRLRNSTPSKPSVYDPIMVLLGPYHHGKEEFSRAEEFKSNCLHWCTNGNGEVKDHFFNLIFSKIDEIRACYAETSVLDKYDDNALALMMLLDACFIINFMEIRISNKMAMHWYSCLGVAGAVPFTSRDIMVLENQIPFFVLKLLISKMYGKQEKLTVNFLRALIMSSKEKHAVIPGENEEPPVHILEAFRRMLVGRRPIETEKRSISFSLDRDFDVSIERDSESESESLTVPPLDYNSDTDSGSERLPGMTGHSTSKHKSYYFKNMTHYHITIPSVTYLLADGVHFHPSPTHHLNDVIFESHSLYGRLHLPICYVSDLTLTFLSNMIAHEIAPDNTLNYDDPSDLAVLSYASFMKSLIQTPSDVRELQKSGILLLNRFGNLEQVVELYKSIDTFTLRNTNLYKDVMHGILEHCNNRTKTSIVELIRNKLRSPWTIIALFTATLLLILTFMQTYYTIHPLSGSVTNRLLNILPNHINPRLLKNLGDNAVLALTKRPRKIQHHSATNLIGSALDVTIVELVVEKTVDCYNH